MSHQSSAQHHDSQGAKWDAMPEERRETVLSIAAIRRSPKMKWDGFSPAVRDRLRPQIGSDDREPESAGEQGPSSVDADAHKAATSPHSDAEMPTDAQMKAQNHQMGHTSVGGLSITIHNPSGSIRTGESKQGVRWFSKVRGAHYGYFKNTSGADGEHVDVYVKPGTKPDLPDDAPVFLIEQVNPKTRQFDEWKAMIGYRSGAEARQTYMRNFPKNWGGFGKLTRMTLAEFKGWLASDKPSNPPAV